METTVTAKACSKKDILIIIYSKTYKYLLGLEIS